MPELQQSTSIRPFLSIPDVIRERIYAYVLTVNVDDSAPWITPQPTLPPVHKQDVRASSSPDDAANLHAKREKYEPPEERPLSASSCLAILATCRTILLEAFHLWYQHNTLNFTRAEDLYKFLLVIGTVRANEIRSIRLDLPIDDWSHDKARFALGRLLRLEKLWINRPLKGSRALPWLDKQGLLLPTIVRGLKGLKEVKISTDEGPLDEGLEGTFETPRRLMRPRPKSRNPPRMVDLFGKLKKEMQPAARDITEEYRKRAYAPDVASLALAGMEVTFENIGSCGIWSS